LLSVTVIELQALMTNSSVSSVQLVEKYLDHIDKHDRQGLHLNEVISRAPRSARLERARQLDGERTGLLHEIPIIVKV